MGWGWERSGPVNGYLHVRGSSDIFKAARDTARPYLCALSHPPPGCTYADIIRTIVDHRTADYSRIKWVLGFLIIGRVPPPHPG